MDTELTALHTEVRTVTLHEDKSQNRQRLLLRILWAITCVGVIIGSLLPSSSTPMALLSNVNDKLIHFTSYGWLAFVPMLRESSKTTIACIATVLLMGIVLELAQGLTGYRSLDPFDMAANASGIACGVGLGIWSRLLAGERSASPR